MTDRQTDRQTGRIDFIDTAKGIGILLVIFGHIVSLLSVADLAIYSFHMPMFFIFSGLFANANKYSFKKYSFRKTKQLLVPYILVFLVGLTISLIVPIWHDFNIVELIFAFSKYSTLGPGLVKVGPIWFLMCLYVVSLAFYPLYKLVLSKNNPIYNTITIFILVLISFVIPRIFVFDGHFFPFCLDIAPMALAFYSIGYIFKEWLLNIEKKVTFKPLIMLICFILVLFIPYKSIGLVGMVNNSYGSDLFLFFICAICGTFFVLLLSTYLKKSKFLLYMGRNTLFIFSFHGIIIRLYSIVLTAILHEEKVSQSNLDFIETIVGFVCVTLIMFLLSLAYNRIKLLIKGKFISAKTN